MPMVIVILIPVTLIFITFMYDVTYSNDIVPIILLCMASLVINWITISIITETKYTNIEKCKVHSTPKHKIKYIEADNRIIPIDLNASIVNFKMKKETYYGIDMMYEKNNKFDIEIVE
jgi:hypothetical protein